jgi:molybdate transport system permease protein
VLVVVAVLVIGLAHRRPRAARAEVRP